MQGSLHLEGGVLYVGSHALTAHVRAFDLEGRRLAAGFSFRDPVRGRSSVDGLALDEDHRLWVADGAARRLRAFTLFGRELAVVGALEGTSEDRCGELGAPSDVLSLGSEREQVLVVASGGRRRHALHLLEPASGVSRSLRPLGDPLGRYGDICDLAAQGETLWVCERRARRVQVFRGGEFHYAFEPAAGRRSGEPCALASLGDGRLALCLGGAASALLVVDGSGRTLEVLATAGEGEGRVLEPSDLAVEPAAEGRAARIFALDRDGERVQVFTPDGVCLGAFPEPLAISI